MHLLKVNSKIEKHKKFKQLAIVNVLQTSSELSVAVTMTLYTNLRVHLGCRH